MNQTLKNFQHIFVFCFALLILFVAPNIVRACSCVRSGTVDKEFAKTPNVAILRVRAVEKYADGEKGYGYGGVKQSRLTVEKVFKGNLKVGEELTFSQGGGGDCVWTFSEESIGAEILFYLHATPAKGETWTAGTCSRSGSAKYRAADLLYFENMAKTRGKTRLSGAVAQLIESTESRLAGRKIRVVGNGKNIELKTDANGVYEIYDLPAGKYKITPEKITGYKFYSDKSESIEVEITAKNHTEQDFNFTIDNRIGGKFFDANGKPLKDVCLNLLLLRGEKLRYFDNSDCTDETGVFEFEGVPAGTYLIVANPDGEIDSDEPFTTFYYPNAARREDASEITIGAGDLIDDLIINAPQGAEIVTVSGVLLFENGKPAADESVKFLAANKNQESNNKGSDARAKTDASGKFTVRILKGQTGKLFGSMYSYIGYFENCPKHDEMIRAQGGSADELHTPVVEIEANSDLNGVELRFPFPNCKKLKFD